ncbi:hypothetical protein C8J56DRAFT_889725 [Mycena floridula]|nr:hypothetical protein C8J56DRAFT_889725 [Mycena floridula]
MSAGQKRRAYKDSTSPTQFSTPFLGIEACLAFVEANLDEFIVICYGSSYEKPPSQIWDQTGQFKLAEAPRDLVNYLNPLGEPHFSLVRGEDAPRSFRQNYCPLHCKTRKCQEQNTSVRDLMTKVIKIALVLGDTGIELRLADFVIVYNN